MEQIDFEVSDKSDQILLTGECKDHKNPFGVELFRKCLERIPESSKVHLVLTNTLVEKFDLTPKTEKKGSKKEKLKDTGGEKQKNKNETFDATDVNISKNADNLKSTAFFKLDCGGEKIQFSAVSIRGVPVLHAEQINRVVIFIELFPKPPEAEK